MQCAWRDNSEYNVLHINTQKKHINKNSYFRAIQNPCPPARTKHAGCNWKILHPRRACARGLLNYFPRQSLAVLSGKTGFLKHPVLHNKGI